jgi:uncharacterized protein
LNIEQLLAEADLGNHAAQAQLSLEYFIGTKITRDLGKAFKYLELASSDPYSLNICFKASRDAGEPAAYFGLAMMWKHGWGVPESTEQYSSNLLKAAELGYPRAQLLIGLDYNTNIFGVKRDLDKSEFWLTKALEAGINEARFHLFHLYTDEARLDNGKAVFHLLKAADSNDGMAQILLGRSYLEGKLVAPDKIEAAKWFILAKEHNHWSVNEVDMLKESLTQNEWNEAQTKVQEWKKSKKSE